MSRIGKKPIDIPSGVEVDIHANVISVKGVKGALSFSHHPEVTVTKEGTTIVVSKVGGAKDAIAIWGTTAKSIWNMIEGVTRGFEKQLELQGVGYRMSVSGRNLDLALGFSHPVRIEIPEGIEAKIEADKLTISGIDRQRVGQFAAEIKNRKPVEPYKGKGFRYVGEHVRMKEGKKAGA